MQFPNEIPAKVSVSDAKPKEQFKKMSPDGADLNSHACPPGTKLKKKGKSGKKTEGM
jgi:hypothetical protein